MAQIIITESQLKKLILREHIFTLNVDIPESIDVDTCNDFLSFIRTSFSLYVSQDYLYFLRNSYIFLGFHVFSKDS